MLHTLDHFGDIPRECQGGIVSIGNFDGVHRGHVQLVQCFARIARERHVPAVAVTFHPHPVELLRPEQSPAPLNSTERKAELLHEHGADEVVVIRTTLELLRLTAEEFFDAVIHGSMHAAGLVEGPNFGFGRDRSGTITTLNRLCAGSNMRLEVVDPLAIDGQVVSSSRARQCLAAGDMEHAARLLGRSHRVRGRVVTGAGRGRALGFPTANLSDCAVFLPANGVYAARATANAETWPAAVHVGPNATFGESARTIEAHLIGFQGDLVGRTIDLDFVERLRETVPFASVAELVRQIERDVEQTRAIVAVGRAAGPAP